MISRGSTLPESSASRHRARPAGLSTVAITTLTSVALVTIDYSSDRFGTYLVPGEMGAHDSDRMRTQSGVLEIDHFERTGGSDVVVHRFVGCFCEPQPDHVGARFEM